MGKKSRIKNRTAKKERMPFVARTFEGLPHEVDWIALREFVPSATAKVTLASGSSSVTVCSLLPGGGAGLVRPDGEVWLGLQVMHNFGDVSRDLAHVLELSENVEPGTAITMTDPGVGPRLQDLLDTSAPFDVEMHEGFDYWLEGVDASEESAALLEQANESVAPTVRLSSVEGAYWTEMGPHRYLRWVMPHDDTDLLDGLARLQAARSDTLSDDSKLIGHFRAHGLLVPVWEFEVGADALEEPAAAFEKRLAEAMAETAPLTPEQRSARGNLISRQVSIR